MKIAVSIGHYPPKAGFAMNGRTEYAECSIIAAMVVRHLEYAGHDAWLIGTGPLDQKVKEINVLNCDCGVEIHLNAGNGHGCETLYCPKSVTGKVLARNVQNQLTDVVITDRGIKEGWYRQDHPGRKDYPGDIEGDEVPDYILAKTNCPFVIVEPFFLDGDYVLTEDYQLYYRIAKAIALGLQQ